MPLTPFSSAIRCWCRLVYRARTHTQTVSHISKIQCVPYSAHTKDRIGTGCTHSTMCSVLVTTLASISYIRLVHIMLFKSIQLPLLHHDSTVWAPMPIVRLAWGLSFMRFVWICELYTLCMKRLCKCIYYLSIGPERHALTFQLG